MKHFNVSSVNNRALQPPVSFREINHLEFQKIVLKSKPDPANPSFPQVFQSIQTGFNLRLSRGCRTILLTPQSNRKLLENRNT